MSRCTYSLILAAAVFAVSCGGDKAPPAVPPVPVRTAIVQSGEVPETVRAVGEVDPEQSALITPQVSGILKEIYFQEGQELKKGDKLFLIDPAPYQSELAQAQAQLQRDKAQLESARAQLQRLDTLVKKDFVSREQYDEGKANAGALAGTVKADEAALENARIRLSYCTAESPISGRAGALLVKVGNVVTANSAEHAVVRINQLKPVFIRFSIPETVVNIVRSRQAESGGLRVKSHRPGTEISAAEGTLTFIDNSVDRNSGTLLLKATFENANEALWPGEFVDVLLELGVRKNALKVPSSAVQTGQQGEYAYAVKADGTAEVRQLKVAFYAGNDAVIDSGLNAGDEVVTDGHVRLFPGAKIERKQ